MLSEVKNSMTADMTPMYSILDIDLDYFNQIPDAPHRLEQLLDWATCPVSMIVERHNHAFARWRKIWRTNGIAPSFILHVDEHHDMMDKRQQTNIANFIYHAMRIWPKCQVHWLVRYPIDTPEMWLEDETWNSFRRRFSYGSERPDRWPKPDVVSVCTSPGFVAPILTEKLMKVLLKFLANHHQERNVSAAPDRCSVTLHKGGRALRL